MRPAAARAKCVTGKSAGKHAVGGKIREGQITNTFDFASDWPKRRNLNSDWPEYLVPFFKTNQSALQKQNSEHKQYSQTLLYPLLGYFGVILFLVLACIGMV